MISHLVDSLVEEINKKLESRSFLSLRELTDIGFFGTLPAARRALQEGNFPFIRISPRRCVIPKAAIIKFLKENLNEGSIRE